MHVGQTGTVVSRIREGRRAGEVRVVDRGVPHTYLAYAAEPMEVGTPVLVIAMLGPGTVEVERWDILGDTGAANPAAPG